MSFTDKVVIVTGASSGIGASIAILFAREGANVTMVGRNETKLKNVAAQCTKKPLVIKADITVDSEGLRIVEETVKAFGKIDVLVNNAGMASYGSILDGKILKAYDETLNINTRAAINLTSIAAPYLVKSKGNIINISSVASMLTSSIPGLIPYCVSKAALDHFTRGAALELSASGVRVNSVNPGPVYTDMHDNTGYDGNYDGLQAMTALDRVSEPEEIAELVAYIAGDRAKGITGSIIVTDNGFLLK